MMISSPPSASRINFARLFFAEATLTFITFIVDNS
jgi:hypothetical protein